MFLHCAVKDRTAREYVVFGVVGGAGFLRIFVVRHKVDKVSAVIGHPLAQIGSARPSGAPVRGSLVVPSIVAIGLRDYLRHASGVNAL